jgi:hypothetical protein
MLIYSHFGFCQTLERRQALDGAELALSLFVDYRTVGDSRTEAAFNGLMELNQPRFKLLVTWQILVDVERSAKVKIAPLHTPKFIVRNVGSSTLIEPKLLPHDC